MFVNSYLPVWNAHAGADSPSRGLRRGHTRHPIQTHRAIGCRLTCRAVCCLLSLAVLPFFATGCALFGKKEGSSERSGGFHWFKKKDAGGTGPAPAKFPGSNDPLVAPPSAIPPPAPTPVTQNPTTAPIALLAGRVVDPYFRPANNTYIRLVNLDGAKDTAAPVDVATTADGYFTIPGLKSGGQYQLIARTKLGEKLLAGITVTQAPNIHVVIQVKEEFATGSIPPLPDAPASPASPAAQDSPAKRDAKPTALLPPEKHDPLAAAWTPSPAAAPLMPGANSGIDLPAKLSVPIPESASPSNGLAPGVAERSGQAWPPTLQIKPRAATPVPPQAPVAPMPPPLPADLQSNLTPLVPSCVLVNGYLQTMALNDVDGQIWNFHKDRKGKLVLLDFWTANCLPCRKTMPILTRLQNKFGPQGLEVIGVALDVGPVKDQQNRIKVLCHQLQANYRQVLAQDEKTLLRQQFNLQYFPSLVLVDDTGRVVWQDTGAPDPATLERVIQKHLGNRTF